MTDAIPPALAELRAKLDALDDQLHDLLMQRAEIIDKVAHNGGKAGVKIRPGREANMVRRLMARHKGSLPKQTLMRIWREIFAGALVVEGGQTIAVVDGDDHGDRLALAREHFGPLTPMRGHHNATQALADLERETSQVAVLPRLGGDEDLSGAWWTALTGKSNGHGGQRLCVIGKLPFWTRRSEGTPSGEAYLVAALRPDPSGEDRGLIALELGADTSRTRLTSLLVAAGFEPGSIWMKQDAGRRQVLVEVAGLVDDNDPRLAEIGGLDTPPTVIGGFAVPLGDDV